MRSIVKDLAFFFLNRIVNKIPSRALRGYIYHCLSRGKINRKSSIGMGVVFLDIRNIEIGAHSNINFDCIIDGRGARVRIGKFVDIAPQVNIWSLEHDPNSVDFSSRARDVLIDDYSWVANRVIVLPGSKINKGGVVGAGAIVSGVVKEKGIYTNEKATFKRLRKITPNYKLRGLRRFR